MKMEKYRDAGTTFKHSLSDSTKLMYGRMWVEFEEFCVPLSIDPIETTPEVIITFLEELQVTKRKDAPNLRSDFLDPRTVSLYLTAISAKLREEGRYDVLNDPDLKKYGKKMRQNINSSRIVEPLVLEHVQLILKWLDLAVQYPSSLSNHKRASLIRDATWISLGYSAALKPSEILGLASEDVCWLDETFTSVRITNLRSGDIELGENTILTPLQRLREWIEYPGRRGEVLFGTINGNHSKQRLPSMQTLNSTLRKHARTVGIIPRNVSSLSLRNGFILDGFVTGTPEEELAAKCRLKVVQALEYHVPAEDWEPLADCCATDESLI